MYYIRIIFPRGITDRDSAEVAHYCVVLQWFGEQATGIRGPLTLVQFLSLSQYACTKNESEQMLIIFDSFCYPRALSWIKYGRMFDMR